VRRDTRKNSPIIENAVVLVRLDEVAARHRKRESQLTCERFIVRADEKLTTFIELESAIRGRVQFDKLRVGGIRRRVQAALPPQINPCKQIPDRTSLLVALVEARELQGA